MSENRESITDADTLRASLARYLESGDEEAMEVIVHRTRSALLRVARRIGAPQDAEDAVQTAYFSLLRKRGQRLDIPVLPWLKTAVVRIAYRQKAKQLKQHELARRLSHPPKAATPLEEIVSADEIVRVRREIARLPSTYRDPVVLRYLQGLSTAETSDLLELPEATVRTRLHRGRHLLRGRLPTPVAYGLVCVPWFLTDVLRTMRGWLTSLAPGGTAPAPAAAMAMLVAGSLGAATGALLPHGAGQSPRLAATAPRSEATALRESSDEIERNLAAIRARRRESALRLKTARSLLAVVRGELRARNEQGREEIAGPGGPPPMPVAGYEEILSRLDWRVIGSTVHELIATVDVIARSRIAREPLETARAGRAQQLNGIMLQATARLVPDLPEKRLSLAVLDPGYMLNVMVSALAAAGHPLDEAQRAVADREVRAAIREDALARTEDSRLEFVLERNHRLALRRKRFIEAVATTLDETQRSLLWPETIRGRLFADLLSESHAYHPGIDLLPVPESELFPVRLTDRLTENLDLTPGERETVRESVDAWIASLPAWLLEVTDDPLEPHGWVVLGRVEAMAAHTARLYRLLRTRLDLGERRLHWIEERAGVIVPLVCGSD